MEALAIILDKPRSISFTPVVLSDPAPQAVVVETRFSGISSGTERLLYTGEMPDFPGMGYPLVPGYESVGRVIESGAPELRPGDAVFVPGARCYCDVRALFGGSASTLHSPADRLHKIDDATPDMTLFALAATAHHAIAVGGAPNLVMGHGALGQLIARVTAALGHPHPRVHEVNEKRAQCEDYEVVHPEADDRSDYRVVMDATGDDAVLDTAIARIAPGGRITLAGFYSARLSFPFPAAFMREASITVAAQWLPADMAAVRGLLDAGRLSFEGLVTHQAKASDSATAYPIAFEDPDCLKMALNWGSNP
ncbi:MAG: chlorophyll synthesis pathway protein BchC [Pseudomonadota bacterium]